MSLKTNRVLKLAPFDEDLAVDEFCHNEIFDVLGNQRRRYIVYYLLTQSDPIECRDIAEQIAAWENNSKREEIGTSQYQSVYNSLYQTHLPELESVGLIEYDRSSNLVYQTDQLAEIERFIGRDMLQFNNRFVLDLVCATFSIVLLSVVGGTFMLLPSDISHLYGVASMLVVLSTFLIRGGIK